MEAIVNVTDGPEPAGMPPPAWSHTQPKSNQHTQTKSRWPWLFAKAPSSRIFISYRRDDTEMAAGRLASDLRHYFGDDRVFRDKESIPPGTDWASEIRSAIGKDGVVLVLIGEQWLAPGVAGKRRIDDQNDVHRSEIAGALKINCRVIPLLIKHVQMPDADELPGNVKPITRINALRLRDEDWDASDIPKLVKELTKHGLRPLRERTRDGLLELKRTKKVTASFIALTVSLLITWLTNGPMANITAAAMIAIAIGLAFWGRQDIKNGLARGKASANTAIIIAGALTLPMWAGYGGQKDVRAAGQLAGVWVDGSGWTVSIKDSGGVLVIEDVTQGSPLKGTTTIGYAHDQAVVIEARPAAGEVLMLLTQLSSGQRLEGILVNRATGAKQPYGLHRSRPLKGPERPGSAPAR